MSKILRTNPNPILSAAVEYHGFVYTQGVVARNLDLDMEGQTKDVLEQIDALLEQHGTDNTRLLQAQIWLKDINDREILNKLWSAWLPEGGAPARAVCRAFWPTRACWSKSCWSPPNKHLIGYWRQGSPAETGCPAAMIRPGPCVAGCGAGFTCPVFCTPHTPHLHADEVWQKRTEHPMRCISATVPPNPHPLGAMQFFHHS